jgi:predicted Rossmann fold flavoprotein
MEYFDIAVIGAGAAGMMCAAVAGQQGRRVVVLDHAETIGEKIRISGGGRCNFTNREATPANYLSGNPHFARSALSRYTPAHFLDLLRRHRVKWHEKHRGQLFCDHSSQEIIDVLLAECATGRVSVRHPVRIAEIRRLAETVSRGTSPRDVAPARFVIATDNGEIGAHSVVIATGGLSIPKIGATGFAFDLAAQWGLPMVTPEPALVPLTFTSSLWAPFSALSGLSLEVGITVVAAEKAGADAVSRKGKRGGADVPPRFLEDLLLTHRGLSGPGVLQASSYWRAPASLSIDLIPGVDAAEALLAQKSGSRRQLATVLAEWLPTRLADAWIDAWRGQGPTTPATDDASGSPDACALAAGLAADARLADINDRALRDLGRRLNDWRVLPAGTEGWRKAEVTRGGVDTAALSSSTMAVKSVPGAYFIGESVDVTGWLGGYNFQWAWASGVAAGQAAADEAAMATGLV